MRSLFVILSLISISCTPINSSTEDAFSFIKVTIPITEEQLSFYNRLATNGDTLCGYNYTRKRLDFWDLTEKKFIRSLPLDETGPHAIENMHSFSLADSSIIFNCIGYYAELDLEGKVVRRIRKDDFAIFQEYAPAPLYLIANNSTLIYHQKTDYVINLLYQPAGGILQNQFKERPVFAKLSLSDLSFELSSQRYPEVYDQKSFGLLPDPLLYEYKGDVYSLFPTQEPLYVNRQGNASVLFDLESLGILNGERAYAGAETDSKKLHEHYSNVSKFHSFLRKGDYFYFTYKKETLNKDMFDKSQNYLLITDTLGKEQVHVKLPEDAAPHLIALNTALYFQIANKKTEDSLMFYAYKWFDSDFQ